MLYKNNSQEAILAMERDRTGNYAERYDSYPLRVADDMEYDEEPEDNEWEY